MIANYHTHTPRCRHAVGSEEEYVRCALDSGMKILGFSDHTPYPFPEGYYSTMRMFPEQLESYIKAVNGLKTQYADQIQIHLGLEVEYYPAYFPELMRRLRDTDIEYMLLGQHWIGNEQNEPYSGSPTDDESCLRRYCAQVRDAMQTGLFTYLAHPDLIKYTGDDRIYTSHMRALCQEANSCGIPLEINLLGVQAARHYPRPRFWEIAAEEGCQVILGCDAHAPEALQDTQSEEKALQIVKQLHLNLVQTVSLRSLR